MKLYFTLARFVTVAALGHIIGLTIALILLGSAPELQQVLVSGGVVLAWLMVDYLRLFDLPTSWTILRFPVLLRDLVATTLVVLAGFALMGQAPETARSIVTIAVVMILIVHYGLTMASRSVAVRVMMPAFIVAAALGLFTTVGTVLLGGFTSPREFVMVLIYAFVAAFCGLLFGPALNDRFRYVPDTRRGNGVRSAGREQGS